MPSQPTRIYQAQHFVKQFSLNNNWSDAPNIDKFDHLHEELTEMSKHLRYKTEAEKIEYIKQHKEIFIDGIGDLFFALCRLANQLEVDIEQAFNFVKDSITVKYASQKNTETKIISSK